MVAPSFRRVFDPAAFINRNGYIIAPCVPIVAVIAFIIRWLALTHFTRRFLLFEILTYQILSIACHGEFILFAENVIKLIELYVASRD